MKFNLKSINSKLSTALIFSSALIYSNASLALDKLDLTQDASGGKNIQDVMNTQDDNFGYGAAMAVVIFCFIGLILIGGGIHVIVKAGKDGAREKPMGGIISIIGGGALFSIAVIAGIIRNSIVN